MRRFSDGGVRMPSVAGRFYPSSASRLEDEIRGYLENSVKSDVDSARAIIVPHAGYVCSGIVAAAGFNTLHGPPAMPSTVFLMGPAHWTEVHGVGLSSAESFRTPLGDVPVASDIIQELLETGSQFHVVDKAHVPEHCLEVELPFLQVVLDELRIVPMLFDAEAESSVVADELVKRLEEDPGSLIVVSSDLSHYLPYERARERDQALLASIVAGDIDGAVKGQACGMVPIQVLMEVAVRMRWTAHLVDYRNSGDTCSPPNEVVGYGAVAYTD